MTNICRSIAPDCYNLSDSYGEICVGCNCCGRIDPKSMYQCRIETEKQHLVEDAQHLTDPDYQREIQQTNILLNIEYDIRKIREARKQDADKATEIRPD